MADGLDVVPVGIKNECAVVRGVILAARPRRAVVPSVRGQGSLVERVDRCVIVAGKGDVERGRGRSLLDPEVRLSPSPDASAGDRVLEQQLVAYRSERVRS